MKTEKIACSIRHLVDDSIERYVGQCRRMPYALVLRPDQARELAAQTWTVPLPPAGVHLRSTPLWGKPSTAG
ncbi:hypothetical protein [Paraburkholderia sp. Ac-20347]|uniref:hypothetical protein n=1 Tax=Paraburkholderia sp. Ac-20347 TaxID=2703892 RepID=UPI0019805E34|nr:hypothetical protein [Paraburkholderia sp. Ac-20347]MBN3812362.1 hypothetical protein [Paraburkholderia sp. Ac-20347]